MAQELRIKLAGLYSYPSDLSAVPPGALTVADNIVLDQDSIAAPRRGFDYLSYTQSSTIHQAQFPLASQRANKYFFFQGNALCHYAKDQLAWFDPTNGWTAFSSAYLPVSNAATGTTVNGSASVTSLSSSTGLVVGQQVFGSGIPFGTYIAAFTSTTLTLSQPATASASGVALTFVTAKVRSAQASQNLFLTTATGVQKLTAYNSTPTLAGVPQALDMQVATCTGSVTTSGSYTNGATVLTVASTAGLGIGMVNNSSSNIPAGAVITDLTATTITISLAATGSGSNAAFKPQSFAVSGPTVSGSTGTIYSAYYWHVWQVTDAHNNEITGAPSQPVLYINLAATASAPNATITIPPGITTAHSLLVYRSLEAASANVVGASNFTLPVPAGYQTYQLQPSAADIAQGTITINDYTPDAFLTGGELYTNTDQQGAAYANLPLPQAQDATVWRDCLFLANTVSLPSFTVGLLGAGAPTGVQSGDTITIGGVTYTAGSSENASTKTFQVFATDGGDTPTGTTSSGSATVTSVSSLTGATAGTPVSCANFPTNTYVVSASGSTIVMSQLATASGSTTMTLGVITAEQAINNTSHSLVRVINQTSGSVVNAQYLMNNGALGVGQILLTALAYNNTGNSFTVTASNRQCWTPGNIVGQPQTSNNSQAKNGLWYSKPSQPEHVPLPYFLPVGSADKNILRIIALRDSLMILKEDGTFILTGTDPTNFILRPLDYTCILIAPESAVLLNNQIYCLTTQGVVTISELGPPIISHPIEGELLALMTQNLPLLTAASFGVAYESDRAYHLFMPTEPTDTGATQYFRWNYITNTWTHGVLSKTCGGVNPATNQLWLGDSTLNITSVERKTLTYADYADYQSTQTISAISVDGLTYTISEADTLEQGDILWQSSTSFVEVSTVNALAGTCTVVLANAGMVTGSCDVLAPIPVSIQWAPVVLENPGYTKQLWEGTLVFLAGFQGPGTVGFVTDVTPDEGMETVQGGAIGPWGLFAWGGPQDVISGNTLNSQGSLWGGSPARGPVRFSVTRDHQRCSIMQVSFSHSYAYSPWLLQGISLIGNLVSERTTN